MGFSRDCVFLLILFPTQLLMFNVFQEVCVIRYEASSDDEKLSYVSLYSYFYSRKRCGVVSNCYTGVKDMYLVPLASHQPIPPELLPFDGPGKNIIFRLKLRLLQAFMNATFLYFPREL